MKTHCPKCNRPFKSGDDAIAVCDCNESQPALDLSGYDKETLCRWWCLMNVWQWPKDFPVAKPQGWDSMTLHEKKSVGVMEWLAVNNFVSQSDAINYWRNVFLPNRTNIK